MCYISQNKQRLFILTMRNNCSQQWKGPVFIIRQKRNSFRNGDQLTIYTFMLSASARVYRFTLEVVDRV
jgi:hypothetical protein